MLHNKLTKTPLYYIINCMKNTQQINILGIESSCDETCASVVQNGRKVLSNVVYSQIDTHKLYGGVVPEIASRSHIDVIDTVVKKALVDADMTLYDIDAIAVTVGAGLVGALFVGVSYAKGLSQASNIPLIAVNHIEGHICSNYITHQSLQPPFISILASGGNTAIVKVCDYQNYNVLATTLDDAVGEAFDKVARVLGQPYPGGRYIDQLAQDGVDTYKFKSVLQHDGNFSYSGLKTAVINVVHNAEQKGETINQNDIAKSFSVSAIDGLVKQAKIQCEKHNLAKLAIAGGVGANSYLRETVSQLQKQGIQVYLPELSLCGDNAAMIASRGYFSYLNNEFSNLNVTAQPTIKLKMDN